MYGQLSVLDMSESSSVNQVLYDLLNPHLHHHYMPCPTFRLLFCQSLLSYDRDLLLSCLHWR